MQNIRIQEEHDFRRFFGRRLLSARKAANLSQKGLAYHLRTGQDTISNYERGKVIPNMLTLYQMAKILGVNTSYFFPDERFLSLSEEEQETMALIPSLSPRAYQFIFVLIQHMLRDNQTHGDIKLKIDPIVTLERFVNGNTLEITRRGLYLVVGLTTILFEGLQYEKMSLKNRALLQRIIDEKKILNSIVHKLIYAHK